MVYSIMGYKNVDYKRKDGSECHGIEFHLLESDGSSLEHGNAVCSVFLSSNQLEKCGCSTFSVGDSCELSYQLNGRFPRLFGIKIL